MQKKQTYWVSTKSWKLPLNLFVQFLLKYPWQLYFHMLDSNAFSEVFTVLELSRCELELRVGINLDAKF